MPNGDPSEGLLRKQIAWEMAFELGPESAPVEFKSVALEEGLEGLAGMLAKRVDHRPLDQRRAEVTEERRDALFLRPTVLQPVELQPEIKYGFRNNRLGFFAC